MLKGETVLSGAEHPGTDLEILRSPSGLYYLGFRDTDGLAYSRESVYFSDFRAVEAIWGLLRQDAAVPSDAVVHLHPNEQ